MAARQEKADDTRPWQPSLRAELAGLLALTAAGTILRFYRLGAQSLWLDEAISVNSASHPLLSIAAGRAGDNHTPPLYYLLLHAWMAMGKSEAGLRALSALLGVVSIPVLYLMGKRITDSRAAFAAAGLLAFSPFHLRYSQEARMYTLVTLLVLGMVYFWLGALRRGGLSYWAGFALFALLSIYTHYYALLAVLALDATFIWQWRRHRQERLAWIGAHLLIAAGLLPWMPIIAGLLARGGQTWRLASVTGLPFQAIALGRGVYAFFVFSVGYSLVPMHAEAKRFLSHTLLKNLPLLIAAYCAFGILFFLGVAAAARKQSEAKILLPLLFLPLLFAVAVGVVVPSFSENYLIFLLPFFCLLLGLGMTASGRLPLRAACATIALALMAVSLGRYYFDPACQREPWREVARFVGLHAASGDGIAFHRPYVQIPFDYYWKGRLAEYPLPAPPPRGRNHDALRDLTARHRRLWLVISHDPDTGLGYLRVARAYGRIVEEKSFGPGREITVALLEGTRPRLQGQEDDE